VTVVGAHASGRVEQQRRDPCADDEAADERPVAATGQHEHLSRRLAHHGDVEAALVVERGACQRDSTTTRVGHEVRQVHRASHRRKSTTPVATKHAQGACSVEHDEVRERVAVEVADANVTYARANNERGVTRRGEEAARLVGEVDLDG